MEERAKKSCIKLNNCNAYFNSLEMYFSGLFNTQLELRQKLKLKNVTSQNFFPREKDFPQTLDKIKSQILKEDNHTALIYNLYKRIKRYGMKQIPNKKTPRSNSPKHSAQNSPINYPKNILFSNSNNSPDNSHKNKINSPNNEKFSNQIMNEEFNLQPSITLKSKQELLNENKTQNNSLCDSKKETINKNLITINSENNLIKLKSAIIVKDTSSKEKENSINKKGFSDEKQNISKSNLKSSLSNNKNNSCQKISVKGNKYRLNQLILK